MKHQINDTYRDGLIKRNLPLAGGVCKKRMELALNSTDQNTLSDAAWEMWRVKSGKPKEWIECGRMLAAEGGCDEEWKYAWSAELRRAA